MEPAAREREATELDEIGRAIVEELQADGRRSYAEIGRRVGLSEAAVRARVTRLIESGYMQIVAVTDPTREGLARQAMIGIRVDGDLEHVAAEIAQFDEVVYVIVCAGRFDLLVEVVVHNDAELLDVLSRRIRATAGVASTDTLVYLKLVKQTYTWGAT